MNDNQKNNNKNYNSPFDEIKSITENASKSTAPAPKEETGKSKIIDDLMEITNKLSKDNNQQRVNNNAPGTPSRPGNNPLKVNNISPEIQLNRELSRADKVRIARQNSLRAKEEFERTKVIGLPAEVKKEQPALMKSDFKTRVTDAVPPSSSNAKRSRKGKKRPSKGETNAETIGRGIISSSVKAIIYIVSVLVVSVCISLFVIFVSNDVFAFVKSDAEISVTLKEGADLNDIAKLLHKNGLIKYPNIFKLYVNVRDIGTDEYISGDYILSPSMNYDTLLRTFTPSRIRKEVSITITEGMTVDNIVNLFVENGMGNRETFIDVIDNYDYDFWFIDELEESNNEGRKYRLEGYLFPDTYYFYSDSSEVNIIYKLLSRFNEVYTEDKKLRAKELGMTTDEVVTLASLIQKEAKFVSEYGLVSSVFHNRLNSNVTNRLLESNATVQYTMNEEDVRLELTYAEIQQYDTPYNTYLYPGLPIGPITNPSLNAINYALYPEETEVKFYYFISDAQGVNHFATTYAQHLANKQMIAEQAAAGQ